MPNPSRTQELARGLAKRQPLPVRVPGRAAPDPARLQRAAEAPAAAAPEHILALQRQYGNRAVQRLIQAKLMVGPANDRYEQEADRVAEEVLRMPLQREEEQAPRAMPAVQRYGGDGGFEAGPQVESRLAARQGSGAPLPASVRTRMEAGFGTDFSGVRVHTDSEAARISRQLSAQAFTHRQDIYMGAGKYNPGSAAGQRLLAHELTHVVQQSGPALRRRALARRPAISAGQVPAGSSVQLARGRFGRLMGSLAGWLLSIPATLGLSALAPNVGDLTARMGFGFEGERTNTPGISPKTRSYTSRTIVIRAADVGLKKDSFALRGVRYDPLDKAKNGPGKGKAIVLLSGSGGSNEGQLEPLARYYAEQGSTVFAVNYRGYGGSRDVSKSGKESLPYLSEAGVYSDAYKIYLYVEKQGYSPDRIVLHGFSLGGGIASHLARDLAKEGKKLGGLVLHSSIRSAYQAARGGVPVPGYGKLAGLMTKMAMGNFDTVAHLEELAKHDPDLPIHLMSGTGSRGDQLALSETGLDKKTAKLFTDVTAREGPGDHLSTGQHIEDDDTKRLLTALLGKGRGPKWQTNPLASPSWQTNPLFET